ncbi:hypothetical protein CRYUN_Cryun06bG0098800 [Craigia yunnanensis]
MFLVFLLMCLNPLPHAFALNQEGLYLQRVKQSLSDPTNALSSWKDRDETPCNWRGISCDSVSGRIDSVDLSEFQLAGPFPVFLCRLPSLRSIYLVNNSINSSLPVDLSTCQNLTTLNLSLNLLVGSLPDSLAKIPTPKIYYFSGITSQAKFHRVSDNSNRSSCKIWREISLTERFLLSWETFRL